jgi:ABC-type nitrate/sulfonate/bicarbonate transport system permease component
MPDLISKGIAGFELANDHFGVLGRFFQTAVPSIAFNLICLIALEILTRALNVPEVLLPRPSRVWVVLLENADILTYQTSVTMFQVIAALILSILFGSALAALFTLSPPVNDMFSPIFVILQIIPKIALAPFFVIWLGTGTASHLGIAVFLSFFPVLIATRSGLEESSADAVRLCRAFGASAWQTLLHVRIPMALPQVFLGAKVATTLSIIGVVLGEFISAQSGIGWYIVQAAPLSKTAEIIAGLLVLSAFGLAMYGVTAVVESLVRRRMFG